MEHIDSSFLKNAHSLRSGETITANPFLTPHTLYSEIDASLYTQTSGDALIASLVRY